ncbi:YdaS family helix-turn-helix protein [Hydrocarboniphaga effusa]|uniref:YdaS family helix-turn-helix protein n=1 Tax=Hydrocarboniphaga effusa TaxID=243629 RepID=UPI00398BBD5C
MDVKDIIDALGGPSKVAQHLKSKHRRGHISRAAVCQWNRIPAEHCMALSELSGDTITPHQMRPDIFGSAPKPSPDSRKPKLAAKAA